jgi:hypothetical protein
VTDVAASLAMTVLFALPLGITLWALLDAARRPQWAWALSGRRQVVWLILILAGGCSVLGGLFVSGFYLTRIRPLVAAAEDGRLV